MFIVIFVEFNVTVSVAMLYATSRFRVTFTLSNALIVSISFSLSVAIVNGRVSRSSVAFTKCPNSSIGFVEVCS